VDFNLFDGLRFEQISDLKKRNTDANGRFPEHTPLGMAYVPFQQWEEPYEVHTGFSAGTIFPELDLPFEPNGGFCDERKR
jgi:hypothetical protein